MIDIFTYKMIYFIFALLVGFFLGYFLKRDSYEDKVKDDVREYEKKFEESSYKLNVSNDELKESNNRLKINQDLLETQQNMVQKIDDDIALVKNKSISLQEAKKEQEVELDNIKNQINEYEEEIKSIRVKYAQVEQELKLNQELSLKLQSLKEQEESLQDKKNKLEKTILDEKDKITSVIEKEKELVSFQKELQDKIRYISEKKALLDGENLQEIKNLVEDTRVKYLNYKYKCEEIEEKISNNITFDKEEIENFIKKNEEQRLVDKVLSKFKSLRNSDDG